MTLLYCSVVFAFSMSTYGCNTGYCSGPECNCEGENECIISCERDDCEIECSHAAESCGAVCGDRCEFECSNTNHCSSYSRADSAIECSSVASCAAECGNNCSYQAHDVSEVHVTVGAGSVVECSSIALCAVVCLSDCEVTCNNVSRCEVDCEEGKKQTEAGGGFVSCD